MIAELIKDLNLEQKQAVVADLGNILVLAGAGSGKTRVLVSRIAWLIESLNISPHEILAVTFTNKAAKEMKIRLREMLNQDVGGMWVGTFHGLAHRLLQRHFQEAKLPAQFHILDSDDQTRLIKRIMQTLNIDPERWPAKMAQSFINSKKEEGIRAKHVFVQSFDEHTKILIKIYKAYEDACSSAGLVDFAELLLKSHELLRDNKDLLSHYQTKFKSILVDEFQDTNTIQYAWIKLLAGNNNNVMAVGDDDQSIYAWRGAKVENIAKFAKDFANTEIIRLEQNYRSSANILRAANSLISNNSSRMGKNLWTNGANGEQIKLFAAFNELEEARFIADEIKKEVRSGRDINDIAVLYRANAQSRVIEEAFLHADISYKIYGGMRFYERAEIKDALAYLRLVVNRDDSEAFERVVNFPTRGIGENTIDVLRNIAIDKQVSHWQAVNIAISENLLTQRAANALLKFVQLIDLIEQDINDVNLEDKIHSILKISGLYEHYQKSKNDLAESKLQNLQELVNAAKQFRDTGDEQSAISAFLTHASLEAGEMQANDYEEHVHMMTMHAAKGLEFSLVFIAGMEEGIFPSKQSNEDFAKLEEERRLCYVGMTRAMHKLVLSYAEIRRQYGREEYHRPSRFIRELPKEFIDEVRVKNTTTTTRVNQPQNDTGFTLGKNVSHPKFGSGVILSIEGSGPNARVQVKFADHGVKWLVLAYANLT